MIDKNEFQNLIQEYIDNKITMNELAKKAGIHKVSVWRIAKKMGITWQHKSKKPRILLDIPEIVRLYEKGHTTLDIAKMMNTRDYIIARRLREHYGRPLHPILHDAICKYCKLPFSQETASQRYNRRYTFVCLDCYNKERLEVRKRMKREVIEGYGSKCACCGETIPEFLTIDHRNGRKLNEYRMSGTNLYYYLKRKGFPKDEYQLLCINCNFARGIYGKCPHEA